MEIPAKQKMRFMSGLRSNGVTDQRVLTAMEKVPRALFVQRTFRDCAYADMALPINSGQTISQPSIVGKMTSALNVGPRDKVLEVGTGSGYQAAVLAHLARRVYTIERHRRLARAARRVIDGLSLVNVIVMTGDGSRGLPDQAPFDRILLTAAAEDLPATLLAQLRVGGIMVLPVGQTDTVQRLLRVEKTKNGLEYRELESVRFVPLVEGVAQDI
ncbi:MAG: protein-L-isoaspartate(D-aspartate) O-methyltransferase [Rhodobacteraceae bacterium]|nr:protein-L-isoaspartate(D-aspartate) O-methyltransferase [Paracoccaceae bacterium]